MAWLSDSSTYRKTGKTVTTEKWYDYFVGLFQRTRTITSWEIPGVEETYASKYVDTYAGDVRWQGSAERYNDAGAWVIHGAFDSFSNWQRLGGGFDT
jgi:hypothetical protein